MKQTGIEGKVAVITGASSGIGGAAAGKFAKEKAVVVAVARTEAALKEIESKMKEHSPQSSYIVADVTEENAASRIIEQSVELHGGIDILVNAAGIIGSGTIENTRIDDWDYMLNINLRAVFLLCQEALPYIIERRGNIVNVSSVTGLRAFPNVLSYCVSKAGLDQFTRCAALELASKGVRVNAVNPGVTYTMLHRSGGMDEKTYADFLERSKETHPLGRVGTAEEVADLIYFLASPSAGWITGATYSIDGGRAQTCAR
jgi:NAD(P)-dependent dehydrogenase (short-subunit alcohol dehydrogenase family)